MKIGSRDTDKSIFIIAEIGNNHEGKMSLAMNMIMHAAAAGADAVKFQAIDPDDFVFGGGKCGNRKRWEQLKAICLPWDRFEVLRKTAQFDDVEFLCTPFNVAAVEFLDPLVPAWKIAARSWDDANLFIACAETGKPIIQSWPDNKFSNTSDPRISNRLLHVVSEYPCPPEHANLRKVSMMGGYSDHTIGIDACVGAAFLGARVIEKHFTTEAMSFNVRAGVEFRSNDHVHSATPKQFKEMVDKIRKAEVLCSRPE